MKFAPTILAVIFLATSAQAADPIVGAWKLDLASSKYPKEARPPKELTETYTERDAATIVLTSNRVSANGTASSGSINWPSAGGIVQDPGGTQPAERVIVEVLVVPGKWWTVFLESGKQTRLLHKQVSADAK